MLIWGKKIRKETTKCTPSVGVAWSVSPEQFLRITTGFILVNNSVSWVKIIPKEMCFGRDFIDFIKHITPLLAIWNQVKGKAETQTLLI